jgi:hypothetical protein
MSRIVDTSDIDLAIEELAVAFGFSLVAPDQERGAIRLACLDLSDEFALHPVWGQA